MPEHFDGIWELRLIYTVTPSGFTAMEHRMTLDVNVTSDPDVGALFPDIDVTGRSGAIIALDTWCDDLITVLEPAFGATASLSRFELWKIPEGTYAGVFYSAYGIGAAGTGASPNVAAWQLTLTFRSLQGGTARLQLMESMAGGNSKISPPYSSAWITDLADFITAPASPVFARDNSFVFAQIHECQGQNERLWRKRYRA